jgi:hypothetical protein
MKKVNAGRCESGRLWAAFPTREKNGVGDDYFGDRRFDFG